MAAAEDAAAVSSDVLLPPPGGKVLKKFLSKLSHGSFLQPCFRAAPASQEAAWELARHCAPRCSRTDQGSRRVGHIVPAEVRSLLAYLSGTGPELPWLQLRNRALLSGVLVVLLSPSTPPGAPSLDTSQCDTLGGEQTASQAVRWFRRRNPTPAANLLLYQPPAALTATGAVAAAAAGSAGGSKRRRDGSTSGTLSANAYTASLADLLCNGYPLPPGPLAAMVASRLPESAPLPPSPKQVDHYSCSCCAEADCTALQAALRADAGAGDAIVVPVTQAVPSPGEACLLGVDCEMVQTAAGHELARLSVVGPGEEGVLLDVLVAPQLPVVDHLTQWSGITAEMLAGPGVIPFQEARGKFQALLASRPGAVLVGHSLENDLHALQLVHLRVMDTALLYPHYAGTGSKNSLRWLTKRYLQRDIQSISEGGGHDSVEDARAALDLALLKVSKGPLFGFPDEKAFYRGNMARPAPPKACSLFTASRTVGGGSTGSPPARVAQWYRPVLVGSPEFVKLHQAGAASSISVLDAADPARVLARAVKESIKLHAQRLASSGAGPLARDAGGEVWAGPGLVVAEGQVQVSGDGGTTEAMALWDAALAAVLPSLPRGSVVVVATQGSVQGPSSHKRQRTEEGDSAQRSAADEGKDDDPTGTHGRVFVLAPTATSSSGEGAAAEE